MSAVQDESQPQTEEEAEPQTPRSELEPQTPRSAQAEAPLASFPLDELPIELKLQTLAHLAHGDLVRLRAVSTKLRDAAAQLERVAPPIGSRWGAEGGGGSARDE